MISETARQFVRRIVPKSVYLGLARQYGALAAARRIGVSEYRRLKRVERSSAGREPARFRVPGIDHDVFVRPGTTDASVLEDVLLRDMYACLSPAFPVRFILDAGANAGYASVFFLTRYPGCAITAVEPDSGNFAMVERNVPRAAARVRAVKAAVWPTSTNLRVQASARADGITVAPVGPGEPYDCVGIDPQTILRESGHERISIFKCDIEGGEEVLFSQSPDAWIERMDALMIEVHSPAAHAAVYGAMGRHPFESYRYRELHVFVRN